MPALLSRVTARALAMPPAVVSRVGVKRRVAVHVRDGVKLLADHYDPNLPDAPTVLVRTPYGRGGATAWAAEAFAARGFHVLVQSCRGTAGSGGTFEPMRDERADGLDTLDWLGRQPWYTGELCTFGPSYGGFVQWALAAEAGPQLKAMAVSVTASDFRDATYAGGSFSLDTVLTWSTLLATQDGPRLSGLAELLRGQPKLRRGLAHLPLDGADLVASGGEVGFYRAWLAHHEPGDPYWDERGHAARMAEVAASGVAVSMVAGWQDIFLPWQLADYAALRAAGATPHLTVGPWTHGSLGLARASTVEAVRWFRVHTRGGTPPAGAPVRIEVSGAWRDLPNWPPPATVRDWFLRPGGGLGPEPSTVDGPPDVFRYDPADPTPAVGGPRLVATRAGVRDNRALEARPDVLVYTSAPLPEPVEVVGPVAATVHTRADAPHFDTFVRLCDVGPDGRSHNVCDGLTRVAGTTGTAVRVELWPTAHRFPAGHRIRVQVSGGAHPRFARNPGTGVPLGAERDLRTVRREVLHAPAYPSAIHLPVVSAGR